MKTPLQILNHLFQLSLCAMLAFAAGCASDDKTPSSTSANSSAQAGSSSVGIPVNYKATDGRRISIGTCRTSEGGRSFKEPHMDKCWIADGFNFNGYDVIYIAPVASTVKVHDDEVPIQKIAEDNLVAELTRMIGEKAFCGKVVTEESGIRPGTKALRLSETIIEYSKGGGAARYFAGLYGGGQPNLKVQGVMTDGDRTVFTYTIRRSGVSGGARTGGAFMKDEDIQAQDIHSMVLDLTDFMAAIAGKYPPAN